MLGQREAPDPGSQAIDHRSVSSDKPWSSKTRIAQQLPKWQQADYVPSRAVRSLQAVKQELVSEASRMTHQDKTGID
ncbi:MAG: hypothetical protein K9L82_10345 [Chromatiaceae bacterium]|nr:hypothetical protein [Chromatiaceae bacterium]MCF8017278.1 hypothetical protein [Chromatiaceae bacterium]